jgi:hypothetical protein
MSDLEKLPGFPCMLSVATLCFGPASGFIKKARMVVNQFRRYCLICFALLILTGFAVLVGHVSPAYSAGYVLIVNKDVPENSLTRYEARSIFLGEKSRWDNGKTVKFAVLEAGAVHRAFLQDVVGKTSHQFLNYWRKKVFNGESLAPKTFLNAQDVVRFVTANSGAVGYVSADYVSDSVKIITIE